MLLNFVYTGIIEIHGFWGKYYQDKFSPCQERKNENCLYPYWDWTLNGEERHNSELKNNLFFHLLWDEHYRFCCCLDKSLNTQEERLATSLLIGDKAPPATRYSSEVARA